MAFCDMFGIFFNPYVYNCTTNQSKFDNTPFTGLFQFVWQLISAMNALAGVHTKHATILAITTDTASDCIVIKVRATPNTL